MEDKIIIYEGDAVKAIGENKVGGYLVRFSSPKDPDLSGEFFTKSTQFGPASILPVFYHHGFDGSIGKRVLGKADVKFDEVGMWVEAQLEMRDEYEKQIYELAKSGKLGWSSGSMSHLVEYESVGKSTWIKTWIVGEASLTPTPAEARNEVIPLKSYLSDNAAIQKPEGEAEGAKAPQSEGGTDAESTLSSPKGEGAKKMEITQEMLQQAIVDAGKSAAAEAVKAYRESEPPVKTAEANITVVKDEGDQPWRSKGEFFMAVKQAGLHPASEDPRLLAVKATGANEAIPSQGGYLVPPEVSTSIIGSMYRPGTLLSQMRVETISSNRMIYPAVDETSRANGSRNGGIYGYWTGEGEEKTASKGAFRQLDIPLHKLAVLCVATDELLADATALESWLGTAVPDEIRFRVEDAIINGDGVAKPYGILKNVSGLTSCTRTDASEIDALDIGRMWGARVAGQGDYIWVCNQGIFPQLLNLSVGQMPVFLPAGGMGGQIYSTLLGRPLIEVEYCPALGTAGDLLLFSPSAYKLVQKGGGIETASSIHVYFTKDETAFRWVYRIGGQPVYNAEMTGFDSATYGRYMVLTATT